METPTDCIFCKIVSKDIPSYEIWNDEEHVAFLSIFPNTEGVTVVIPKQHYPSYFADAPKEVTEKLLLAVKQVAHLLDENLPDVGRSALVFEGFGVNHLHAKLFPMHGTKNMAAWQPIHSDIKTYFEKYEGYISTHDGELADGETLKRTVEKIKKVH